MNMLTKAKKAELRLNRNLIAVAVRVDSNTWDIRKPNGDRSDRMGEEDLLRWIATNNMAATITEEESQEVVLPVRVDLGDSLAQLRELGETLQGVIVTAMLARQVGIVMGVDPGAEGGDVPSETFNEACGCAGCTLTKQGIEDGTITGMNIHLAGTTISSPTTEELRNAKAVSTKEQYDHLAVKYAENCKQKSKLYAAVTEAENTLAERRQEYNEAADIVKKQYAQLMTLHTDL